MTPRLSRVEQAQLGTFRRHRDGTPSDFRRPPRELWAAVRAHLVARSAHANPGLDPALTAYTPGETRALLRHPTVRGWHDGVRRFRVPSRYHTIVLVPCAKTKPWEGAGIGRSRLYSDYNRLRREFPSAYFVTISEPLGIVPMDRWADFPQYDNPGLFRDDSQRSGMTTREWLASPFGEKFVLPFDETARRESIEVLGDVVAGFLSAHRNRRIVSFVDSPDTVTTHSEMLTAAIATSRVSVERYRKRPAAHRGPHDDIAAVLSGRDIGGSALAG